MGDSNKHPDHEVAGLIMRPPTMYVVIALFLVSAFLGSCNPVGPINISPTINATQAYQTVEARLTQALAQTPAATQTQAPTESGLPSPTPISGASATPQPTPSITPTPLPCDRARFVADVTIPDNTKMEPNEAFTKVWRLINSGTCTWTREYAAVWFSGEMLSAPSFLLIGGNVDPGKTVDITVDMVAPSKTGTYQSNWKLRNAAGLLYGIGPNGDFPFWVRIAVVEQPTDTPIPSPIPTITPTPTSTPEVQASGPANLVPGDFLDLDTLQVNSGTGEDLLYQTNENNNPLLSPQGGGRLGVFGSTPPSLQACQSASLSTASLPVQSFSVGTYLCYQTDESRFGWLRLSGFDSDNFDLILDVLTWAQSE